MASTIYVVFAVLRFSDQCFQHASKSVVAAHHMHTRHAKMHTKLFQHDNFASVAASGFVLFELSGEEVTNRPCLNAVA